MDIDGTDVVCYLASGTIHGRMDYVYHTKWSNNIEVVKTNIFDQIVKRTGNKAFSNAAVAEIQRKYEN